MLIEFLLLLLLYQITGDCLIQYDRILFKRKIERFTLLEQIVFSLIFGMLINTAFTIFIIYIGPFSFLLLILLNFLFIILCIILNKRSVYGFFYWRIYSNLKDREKNNISWHYYRKFLFFFIGIIILDLYIKSFIYKFEFVDLNPYANYALNSIRDGWNLYDPDYFFLGYKIRIFTFLLIPFYAIAPSEWIFISGNYLFQLQFFLFFTLVFIILYKFDSKFSILLIFFITAAIVIFPSWFTYFLPSNFFIVLLLGLVIFLFNKDMRSLFLEVILFIFLFIIHIPSAIAMYFIPSSITLIIIWYKNPDFLFKNYYKKKAKVITFIKKNRWKVLLLVIIIIISATLFIIRYFSFIVSLWNKYLNIVPRNAEFPPLLIMQGLTLGFIINIIVLIYSSYLLKKKMIKEKKYQILFLILINLYHIIYILGFEFWNEIIRTTYPELRFIVPLDISLILLIPILYSIIKSNTKFLNKYTVHIKNKLFLINDYLKKYNLNLLHIFDRFKEFFKKKKIQIKKYINISNIVNLSILFSLLFYCMIKAIPNYEKRYYRKRSEDHWVDEYYYATLFLSKITLGYETYMYNGFASIISMRHYFEINLGDLRCINHPQMFLYSLDYQYEGNNSKYQYQLFLNFIFNETKFINKNQANYKDLPEYLKVTKLVDYIIFDNSSNPNLCELMANDTSHFRTMFKLKTFESEYILMPNNQEIDLYIFKTKS